jgi:hypothetical protein
MVVERRALRRLDAVSESSLWRPSLFSADDLSLPLLCYELCLLVSLVLTATVTPFELAFLWKDQEWGTHRALSPRAGWLFVLNRWLDLTFLVDIAVQCNTSFFDDKSNALCTDRRLIVTRYLADGSALVDVLACLPLDLISQPARCNLAVVVIRVLRLLKLSCLGRLPRLTTLQHDRLQFKSGHLKLVSFLSSAIALSHLLACGLVLVSTFQRGQGTCTWIDVYESIVRPTETSYNGLFCPPLSPPPSISSLYLAALVWSVETMTTVGYGDVVAVTNAEHAYVILAMFVGGAFFSYVVGNFVSVLQELNARQAVADRTSALHPSLFESCLNPV